MSSFIVPAIVYLQIITIKFIVQDSKTRLPVPYASVGILHSSVGTVSNDAGAFSLNVSQPSEHDTLVINAIGYTPYKVPLSEFPTQPAPAVIHLVPQPIQLKEAVVTGYTAESLLQKAVSTTAAKVKSPALLHAYYREFVKVNGHYTKFSDAKLDYHIVANPQDIRKPQIQVHIKESRAQQMSEVGSSFENLNSVIGLTEIINNGNQDPDGESNFLFDKNFKYYYYSLTELNAIGQEFYIVRFTPKTKQSHYLFNGTILIDKHKLLIKSIESSVASELLLYSHQANLLVANIKLNGISKKLLYESFNNEIYPKYSRVEVGANVQIGNKPPIHYIFSSEALVDEVDAKTEEISKNERSRAKSLYEYGNNYKTKFWERENIIVASPKEQAIIDSLFTLK